MAKQYSREEIKKRFQDTINSGKPIVIPTAGIGISAKFAEKGGADMIGLFSSAYLGLDRPEATSLMPYGNANDIMMDLCDRIFPIVGDVPMLAGMIGSDPTREMVPFLKIMQFKGFSAVINFPSPGYAYGQHRRNLERNNYGVEQELKVLKSAHDLGFYTFGMAYDEEIAMQIAEAEHDALVLGLALVEWEKGGATLEEAAAYIDKVTAKVKTVAPEMLIFVQGYPVQTPEDTQYIYDHTGAVGVVGINNMEYGAEPIKDTVEMFKKQKLGLRK